MCGSVSRVQLDRALQGCFTVFPLPVVETGMTERCVGLRKLIINSQCHGRGSLCFCKPVVRLHLFAHYEKRIGVGKPGICGGITRVKVYRLPETFDTSFKPLRGALVPVI